MTNEERNKMSEDLKSLTPSDHRIRGLFDTFYQASYKMREFSEYMEKLALDVVSRKEVSMSLKEFLELKNNATGSDATTFLAPLPKE